MSLKIRKKDITRLMNDNNEEEIDISELIDSNVLSDVFQNLIGSMETRSIYITGFIEEVSIESVIAQIHMLESKNREDIHIYVNSDGGYLQDCFALIDIMDSSPCDICTFTVGRAASAACLIASNGTKGKRYGGKNAEFMFHELYGDIVDAKKSNLSYHRDMFDKTNQKVNKIFCKNTGQTIKNIKNVFYDRNLDRWMNCLEAKKFGIIDKIMKKRKYLKDGTLVVT